MNEGGRGKGAIDKMINTNFTIISAHFLAHIRMTQSDQYKE